MNGSRLGAGSEVAPEQTDEEERHRLGQKYISGVLLIPSD